MVDIALSWGLLSPHNPKVAGSNPAPATNKFWETGNLDGAERIGPVLFLLNAAELHASRCMASALLSRTSASRRCYLQKSSRLPKKLSLLHRILRTPDPPVRYGGAAKIQSAYPLQIPF